MMRKAIFLFIALSTILAVASAAVAPISNPPTTSAESQAQQNLEPISKPPTTTLSDRQAQKKPDTLRAKQEEGVLDEVDHDDYEDRHDLNPDYIDEIEYFGEESLDGVARYDSKTKASRRQSAKKKAKKPAKKSKGTPRRRRRRRRVGKPAGTRRERKPRSGPKQKTANKKKKRTIKGKKKTGSKSRKYRTRRRRTRVAKKKVAAAKKKADSKKKADAKKKAAAAKKEAKEKKGSKRNQRKPGSKKQTGKRRRSRGQRGRKRLPKGDKRKQRKQGKNRKKRIQKRHRGGKGKPYYPSTRPATTKRLETTQTSPTKGTTKPTGYISGQNDKNPPQCKCRAVPDRGGICYDMKKGKHIGRCRRRDCGKSYECVTGKGRGLRNCYRRYAFEEVQVIQSYKGMHKCKRVKYRVPKVFYSPYY